MAPGSAADLLIVNGCVVTLDGRCPTAEAVAVRGGRVVGLGRAQALQALVGPNTRTVDAGGDLVAPAFHDPHLHLLSYVRSATRVACDAHRTIAEIQAAIRERARDLPPGAWVRAAGYDDTKLPERRHPDRHDLDAAVPDRPVRLQHRTLHLDVLNTPALRTVGLLNADRSEVERDAAGEATGRLYNAARLLHRRLPEPGFAEIEADTRRVSRQLSAWGVTTIQDASPTNDADTWHLFQRLQARGALRQRAFVLPGEAAYPEAAAWASSGTDLALGPVKLLVDEATTDPDALSETIRHARAAGHAVALHAVSDAEAAIALASLQAAGPRPVDAGSDRIEHGALIPDALLPDLHAAGVVVVGQPGLLRTRGDQYLADHHPEQHPWLYRARSLVDHSITYAASSDAPLLPPDPALALLALRTRETISGEPFGRAESLDILGALASCTLAPARAVGRQHDLGRLTIGALADLVILDRYWMEAPRPAHSPVRLTIQAGEVTSGGP